VEFCDSLAELIEVSTGIDAVSLYSLRNQLYDAVMDETSMELPLAQKAAFHAPIDHQKLRRESFSEYPRSVYEHHQYMKR